MSKVRSHHMNKIRTAQCIENKLGVGHHTVPIYQIVYSPGKGEKRTEAFLNRQLLHTTLFAAGDAGWGSLVLLMLQNNGHIKLRRLLNACPCYSQTIT